MVSQSNAEHYAWGNNRDGWRLMNQTDLSMIHERMPPGTNRVRHYHQTARQFFFVLSGVATIETDGKREVLSAHKGIEVGPSQPHPMMKEWIGATKFLVISHPTTQGDRCACHLP